MKVLFLIPPRIAFNLTIHYRYNDLGELLDYLRKKHPSIELSFWDCQTKLIIEKDLVNQISEQNFDAVVFYSIVADSPSTKRLATILKAVCPKVKIAIFGTASLFIPQYFKDKNFDCIHINGDAEITISDFLDSISRSSIKIRGASYLQNGKYAETKGERLSPSDWGFPALDLLPLKEYKDLCKKQLKIPFGVSIYAGKGCPRQCSYCVIPRREGNDDRRRDPNVLLDWIVKNIEIYDFELVSIIAANIANDTKWLENFCGICRKNKKKFIKI